MIQWTRRLILGREWEKVIDEYNSKISNLEKSKRVADIQLGFAEKSLLECKKENVSLFKKAEELQRCQSIAEKMELANAELREKQTQQILDLRSNLDRLTGQWIDQTIQITRLSMYKTCYDKMLDVANELESELGKEEACPSKQPSMSNEQPSSSQPFLEKGWEWTEIRASHPSPVQVNSDAPCNSPALAVDASGALQSGLASNHPPQAG